MARKKIATPEELAAEALAREAQRRRIFMDTAKKAIERSGMDDDLAQQIIKTIDGEPLEPKWAFRLVRFALDRAANHLDYTGNGDRWERECAEASGLDEVIELALAVKCQGVEL